MDASRVNKVFSFKRRKQMGITLVVVMVILVLMTLLAISVFYFGKGSMQSSANMQQRNEVLSAANSVVEQALSSTLFFSSPSSVFPVPCATPNTLCVDTNGDSTSDIVVTLSPVPSCIKVQTISNDSLDLSNSDDLGCTMGVQQSFGVVGATSASSMCANSVWEITAVASDSITQAQAFVTQGVSVRIAADDASSFCP
jgi:Tfp pilus assembly protein PilX